MNRKQAGFTLIELIIVIAILSILAAMAIPRYLNAQEHARVAAVEGLAGAIKGSVSIVQAFCILNPKQCSGAAVVTVNLDGTNVDIATAYKRPTNSASGIGAAASVSGVTANYLGDPVNGTTSYMPLGGNSDCQVTYTPVSGAVIPVVNNCA